LTEKVKGNSNAVQGQSLDNLLDGSLSIYERSSTGHKLLSWDASLNEESASDFERIAGEVVVGREENETSLPRTIKQPSQGPQCSTGSYTKRMAYRRGVCHVDGKFMCLSVNCKSLISSNILYAN
jgi:hypothetical protein